MAFASEIQPVSDLTFPNTLWSIPLDHTTLSVEVFKDGEVRMPLVKVEASHMGECAEFISMCCVVQNVG